MDFLLLPVGLLVQMIYFNFGTFRVNNIELIILEVTKI